MSNLKIALDLDGTLADIIGLWLREYNKKSENRLEYDEIDRWDFWVRLGYTSDQFFKELSECWNRWMHVKPLEDNISFIVERLSRLGKVDIVTARDPENNISVKRWLEYHEIPYNDYILVARGIDKAELDYDLFIDDSPINAKQISNYRKMVLLYSQPWNRDLEENMYVRRIKYLLDAIELIPNLFKLYKESKPLYQ